MLQIEDNPADTRLIRERVIEVSSDSFTWENVERLNTATGMHYANQIITVIKAIEDFWLAIVKLPPGERK